MTAATKHTDTTLEMSSAPPLKARPGESLHLLYLDGVRGLAALFVVIHHIFVTGFLSSTHPRVQALIFNVIGQGHLAVDVFIVLSGFCLMLPVARSQQLKGGWRGFYARRARRILPTFYYGFAVAALIPVLFSFTGHPHVWPPFTGAGFLVNGLLLQDVFVALPPHSPTPPLGAQFAVPFWSVAAEWQIYFLFPLLVGLWQRRGSWAVVGLTAILGYSLTAILLVRSPKTDWSHTCPWYLLLFGVGMCAGAAYSNQRRTKLAPWTALAFSSAVLTGILLYRYPFTNYAVYAAHLPLIDLATGAMTAALLALLGRREGWLSRGAASLLSWKPLVFLGTFAYSLYLTHWTLLVQAEALVRQYAIANSVTQAGQDRIMFLLVLPIVILFAYLFHLLCERPLLVSRRRETVAEVARDAALSPAP